MTECPSMTHHMEVKVIMKPLSQDTTDLIFSGELNKRVPYSSTHIRRLESQGKFPNRIRLGPNRIGWLRAEIDQWLATKVEAR